MVERQRVSNRAPSPFTLLRTQASRRPTAVAMTGPVGSTQDSMTWAALFGSVQDLAAGLLSSGVRDEHVALVAVSPGPQAVVVELALRAIGVVSVRLGPEAGVEQATRAFTPAPVSLVVVDHADVVDTLSTLPLERAKLLDLSDTDNLAGLVEVGRERLRQEPDVIARADQRVITDATLPRLIAATGEPLTADAEPRLGLLLTPRDRVLLVGRAHEPFTMQVRGSCLATGAELSWIPDLGGAADAIGALQPTVLALDSEATANMETTLVGAKVDHRPWHSSPDSVLDAVLTVASGRHAARGARRRATAISMLRPWFGAELTQVLTAAPSSPRVQAAWEALGLDVDVETPPVLVPTTLPRPAARRRRAVRPLPQRSPSPVVDPDFAALAVPEPEVEIEADEIFVSPHLRPLTTTESFLDRVLAQQAAVAGSTPGRT